jgi:hypothetical protein
MGKNPKQRPMSKSPRGGDDLGSLINEIISTIQGGNSDNSGGLDPEEKIIVTVPVKDIHGGAGNVSQSNVSRKDSAKVAKELKEKHSR